MDITSLPQYPERPRPPAPSHGPDQPGPQHLDPDAALKRFRFWRRVMIVGWLSVLPLCSVGLALGLPAPALLVLPGVAAFWVGSGKVFQFRCPRCGRLFVFSWWWQNAFARKCVHCGYPIRGTRAIRSTAVGDAGGGHAEPSAAPDRGGMT